MPHALDIEASLYLEAAEDYVAEPSYGNAAKFRLEESLVTMQARG